MKIKDWSVFRHFKPTEKWGNPDEMEFELVKALDDFRDTKDTPLVIMEGFATSGHSERSYHYKGMAVDCRFVDPKTKLAKDLQFHTMAALQSPFGGIGIYTWGASGPFLHLDIRPVKGQRVMWISESPRIYKPLTIEFLHRIFKSWPPQSSSL